MNLIEVKKSLDKLFAAEPQQGADRNIVFWYDEDGSFVDEIDGLALANAKIIKLYDNNAFAVKLMIECEDIGSNLLVYSPMPRPQNKDNWLTDIIKYSQTFSTDEASLILLNYKMDTSLRKVADEYKVFFRNKERESRFAAYGLANINETKFDVAVLSALCKLPAPSFEGCVCTILSTVAEGDLSLVEQIEKFGSLPRFWRLVEKNYGYAFPEHSFEKLAILLLITHLSHSIGDTLPKAWIEYNAKNTNCFVLVDNFMKNTERTEGYSAVSLFVAEKLNLTAQLAKWNIADIEDCDTFPQLDEAILTRLRGNIESGVGEYEQYKKVINNRRNRRWFHEFDTEYSVLNYACEFLNHLQKHGDFSAPNAKALWQKYQTELYQFDRSYRKFVYYFDMLSNKDDYQTIAETIENTYVNGFLNELAVKWCALLDDGKDENGFIPWALPGVTEHEEFYNKYIRRFVSDNERIVVIISDALRYESAMELTEILTREHKGETDLTTMLGVIPSYTDLGMAALLPHKSLEISDNGDIFADGVSTKGTANRDKILKVTKAEAVAVTYDEISGLTGNRLAERFTGQKLIYIYHNVIDARGDNAATEREVFEATEKAFRELSGLVRKLQSGISAINFILTADHGYIYRRTPLQESDKTPKETEGSIVAKRRFILTRNTSEVESTQRFSMRYMGSDDIVAIVPRGANCFKIQGAGSNYVHGGSSLQEVTVPVIKYKSGKNLSKISAAKKVTVSLTSLSRKITSIITYLDFFQNEAVADKLIPTRVKAYFEDENGERISNENIIIAESSSTKPEERSYKEKFTLRNIKYDKAKNYYLVIVDDEEMVGGELERIPFTVDLVFGSGIQF